MKHKSKKLRFNLSEAINIQMGNYKIPLIEIKKVEQLNEDGTTTDITDQDKAKLFVVDNLEVIANENIYNAERYFEKE